MCLRPATLLLPSLLFAALIVGCAAQRTLTENPPQSPRYLRIEPAHPLLRAGEERRFFAWGVTEDGYEVRLPAVEWSVERGQVDGGGLFRAAAGPDVVLLSARYGGLYGYTSVKIAAVAVEESLRIEEVAGVTAGFQHRFRALQKLAGGGEQVVTAEWDAGTGWIDADGLYTAPGRSGEDYVTARAGGKSATLHFAITPRPAVLLWIRPSRAEVPFDGGLKFSAWGVDELGNVFPAEARFSVDEGTISVDGAYRPGPDNLRATVTATAGAIIGRAELTVRR